MNGRIKISENFYLDEFVDPWTYAQFGSKSIWFIDKRIVEGVQFTRDQLGPLVVNNWATGGKYKLSGLRPFNTSIGAKYSQHKYKNGADVKSSRYKPADIHEFWKANEDLFIEKQWVTRIENLRHTPTWAHGDNAYTGLDNFLFVGI